MAQENLSADDHLGHDSAMACRARDGGLSVRDVSKVYDPEGVHVVALDKCNLAIEPGEFVAIVGPSGCGKSTLLNIIAGFDNLSSGQILMDGRPLATKNVAPKPGSDRVVVFQHGALFPWKTVLENITYGPVVQSSMSEEKSVARAREMLNRMGLQQIESTYPGQLSSGMQRRVEIIRALINDPKLLLLDEPFRAMDTVTKSASHQYLLELFDATGKTIFFITHDLEEAIFLADKVHVMTSRPGYIKKSLHVDLPRPRHFNMLSSTEFIELQSELVEAVHEEALKAFQAGERELA